MVENKENKGFNSLGNLELQSSLYDTGLQNIFNDYQKQIGSLDESKRKEVEDAYYIKELSKKYLGEYSSNQGVGDVSGQLLEIYGKYQDNINLINQNYNSLKGNLDQLYTQEKRGLESEIVQKQKQDKLSEIRYNLSTGMLPNGMSTMDYLDSVRGTLGEQAYWELATQYKGLEINEATQNALNSIGQYQTQEDWNKYIDEMVNGKKINSQQGEYLKSKYSTYQNLNFKLYEENVNLGNHFDDVSNLRDNAKKYISNNGETLLAETKNEVLPNTTTYGEIEKSYNTYDENGEISSSIGYDTPFAHGNKWFVAKLIDGEKTFVELAQAPGRIAKKQIQSEELDKVLNKKNGVVDGVAYTYDWNTDSYQVYVDYQPSKVTKKLSEVLINGKMYDLGEEIKSTQLIRQANQELARVYKQNGILSVDELRKGTNESNFRVIELNNEFYTYKKGKLYKLKRK